MHAWSVRKGSRTGTDVRLIENDMNREQSEFIHPQRTYDQSNSIQEYQEKQI